MYTKTNYVRLKIKSISLADEARTIRRMERRYRKTEGVYTDALAEHRKSVVREEARATHLARAYLKGEAYLTLEPKVKDIMHLEVHIKPKVKAMVKKYGGREAEEHLGQWYTGEVSMNAALS